MFFYVPDESSLGGLDPKRHLSTSQTQECKCLELSWLGHTAKEL